MKRRGFLKAMVASAAAAPVAASASLPKEKPISQDMPVPQWDKDSEADVMRRHGVWPGKEVTVIDGEDAGLRTIVAVGRVKGMPYCVISGIQRLVSPYELSGEDLA